MSKLDRPSLSGSVWRNVTKLNISLTVKYTSETVLCEMNTERSNLMAQTDSVKPVLYQQTLQYVSYITELYVLLKLTTVHKMLKFI